MRWLLLEAVKAACLHRVELGDVVELVVETTGNERLLWPGLVASTACGRLMPRSVGLVIRGAAWREVSSYLESYQNNE